MNKHVSKLFHSNNKEDINIAWTLILANYPQLKTIIEKAPSKEIFFVTSKNLIYKKVMGSTVKKYTMNTLRPYMYYYYLSKEDFPELWTN